MPRKKGLTLIEVLIGAGLLIIIGGVISSVLVYGIRNYKKNEVKVKLNQEARNVIDRISADFRAADSSTLPWTNLAITTPPTSVTLSPGSGSFYFKRKPPPPATISEQLNYSINSSGELLRNNEVTASNIQNLTVTLRETTSTTLSATVTSYSLDISVNLSKGGITLALDNKVEKRSVIVVALAPTPTPNPTLDLIIYVTFWEETAPTIHGYFIFTEPSSCPITLGLWQNAWNNNIGLLTYNTSAYYTQYYVNEAINWVRTYYSGYIINLNMVRMRIEPPYFNSYVTSIIPVP